MPQKKQGYNFEKSIEELEKLVERMESGQLSLEESLGAFEQGVKLTRECQTMLTKAEQKVEMLVEKNDRFYLETLEEQENGKD